MYAGPGTANHPNTVPGGGGQAGTPGKDHAEQNVAVVPDRGDPRLFGCRLILFKSPTPHQHLPYLSLS
jgi:hypothetical protein